MVARWTLGISFFVGRDDSARRSITGGSPRGTRRFFEGGFAGFLSEAPPAPPKRGLLAAVGCTDRAKTGLALPPAPLAGACGNWGPRRSPAKRVRWGEEVQWKE